MTVYLSEAGARALEQPREIFTSTAGMCFQMLLYVLAAALLGGIPFLKHGSLLWPGVALALLLLGSFGVIKHWKYRTRPILVLSKEGLRVARKDGDRLIPWANLTENVWHENRYAFLTTSSTLSLRDDRQPKSYLVYAKWLTIGSDEYLRLCDLYAAASRGHGHE